MTYTPMLGENLNMVAVRYCCFNWADADSYREWGTENEVVQKHWSEKVDPHVAQYGHYFDEVSWVNSTGLGILISGYTTLKKSGGELKLLNVSDRIQNIFIVSKLFTVFESFQDEDEAVRSFS